MYFSVSFLMRTSFESQKEVDMKKADALKWAKQAYVEGYFQHVADVAGSYSVPILDGVVNESWKDSYVKMDMEK